MRQDKRAARAEDTTVLTIKHGINPEHRRVVMEFSRPITNTASTPTEAVLMAKALLEGAQMLEPTSVEGYGWPGKKAITEPMQFTPKAS